MGSSRFLTRRQWHNTRLMAWIVPVLLLVGVLVFAAKGLSAPLFVLGGLGLLGVAVALIRDMGRRCVYQLIDDRLVMQADGERLEVDLDDVVDASLVDRAAAREYIRNKLGKEALGRRAMRKRLARYVKFCSVDIGLTTLTLGMGRSMIDRMPDARNDLVLLRMRDTEDFLLSPQYNQDLVASINRLALQRRKNSPISRAAGS